MILSVKVSPNARKNSIESWQEGILHVKIHAVPDKGKANRELIVFLSKTLDLPKSNIELLSGETSRQKRLNIRGVRELTWQEGKLFAVIEEEKGN